MKSKLMFSIGIVLFILFIFTGALIIAIQSEYGQRKIIAQLADAMKDSGWHAEVGSIKGNVSEEIAFQDIHLDSPDGDQISIRSLKVRLSLIRLLKREIAFTKFHADQIQWNRTSSPTAQEPKTSIGIPFSLIFSNLQLTNVSLPDSQEIADIKGQLKIGKYNKRTYCKLQGDLSSLKIGAQLLVKPSKETLLKIDLNAPSFTPLSPWIKIPVDGNGELHLYAKGPWSAFSALIFGGAAQKSIRGQIHGFVSIDDTHPFLQRRWKASSSFEKMPNEDTIFTHLTLKSDQMLGKGRFALGSHGEMKNLALQFTINSLQKAQIAPVDGKIVAQFNMPNENEASLTVTSEQLSWGEVHTKNSKAILKAEKERNRWSATFDLETDAFNQKWTARSDLQWQPREPIKLDDISVHSNLAEMEGNLEIFPDLLFKGELQTKITNLQDFNPFNLINPIYGAIEAKVRWKIEDNLQALEIDAKGSELYYDKAEIDEAYLYADLSDPFHHSTINAYVEIHRARWESVSIDTGVLNTTDEAFHFSIDGEWKGPFDIAADGFYENGICHVQEMAGSLFFQPLILNKPFQLAIGSDFFRMSEMDILIGNASLKSSIESSSAKCDYKISLNHFPLDFLSVNPLDLSVTGVIDLEGVASQIGDQAVGSLHAHIADVEIASIGDEIPVSGNAEINASLKNRELALTIDMEVRNHPLMQLKALLPVQADFCHFQAALLPKSSVSADFAFDGQIEELLDFFDLGAHRLEGYTFCDLHLSGTLQYPILKGDCQFEDGIYENYYAGIKLQNIQADLLAERHSLYLRSLTAQNSDKKGRFSLNGELEALWMENFPFKFEGDFSRLNVADIQWLKTEAGGTVQIVGNASSARLSGQATILKSDVTIPERIPASLPNLPVKYINAPKPILAEKIESSESRYPIFFDYRVFAPDGVFISGRGLSSEWKGDFQVGGTYTDIEARGRLDMIKGEFSAFSRSFNLTEGSLTFSGKPHEMPLLNIAARMNLQHVAIIARLRGMLDAPQLSFQSIPPLPMGSILSYLLFGQDLSEISAVQAAQLVNSVATLTGEGSNITEGAKRSLGVDRLRVIATPIGDEGGETYALQVGKYVTRGILISVSQGYESNSTNLAIEVDLVNGFVFEAESQQLDQQQGKFTIKWNLNY